MFVKHLKISLPSCPDNIKIPGFDSQDGTRAPTRHTNHQTLNITNTESERMHARFQYERALHSRYGRKVVRVQHWHLRGIKLHKGNLIVTENLLVKVLQSQAFHRGAAGIHALTRHRRTQVQCEDEQQDECWLHLEWG